MSFPSVVETKWFDGGSASWFHCFRVFGPLSLEPSSFGLPKIQSGLNVMCIAVCPSSRGSFSKCRQHDFAIMMVDFVMNLPPAKFGEFVITLLPAKFGNFVDHFAICKVWRI